MTGKAVPHIYAALRTHCALFLIGLDITVLNVALPSLQVALRPGPQGLLWIADGYILALACGVLAAGAWSDTRGRRRAFTFGLALSGTASAYGALATRAGQVVGARVVMGIGAALLMPSTLSLVTVVFPEPAVRRRAIVLWTLAVGLGCPAGPVVGGLLAEEFGWRVGFWINVPVVVLALAGAWRWVPESAHPRPGAPDRIGMLAVTAGLLALVWATTEGPDRGWSDPLIGAGFLTAATVLGFLAVWEKRHPSPMLPPGLFRDRRLTAAASTLGWMSFAVFGSLFLPTLYLQTILGYTPVQAGLGLLPLATASSAWAGVLIAPRWGDKTPVTAGMLLAGTGFAFLACTTATAGYAPVLAFQLVVGAGLAAAPATEAAMGSVAGERAGTGAAVNDLVREVGGTRHRHPRLPPGRRHSYRRPQAAAHPDRTHSPPVPGSGAAAFLSGLHTATWAARAAALLASAIATRYLSHHAAPTPDAPEPAPAQALEREPR